MSAQALDMTKPGNRMMAVLAMPGLSHAQARILAVIAFHDGPGGAHPTADTIGREAGGITSRTAREHIAKMVERGVLTKRKGQRGDHYSPDYDWSSDRRKTRQSENLRHDDSDRPVARRSEPSTDDAQTGGRPVARPADSPPVNRKEPESISASGDGALEPSTAPLASHGRATESESAAGRATATRGGGHGRAPFDRERTESGKQDAEPAARPMDPDKAEVYEPGETIPAPVYADGDGSLATMTDDALLAGRACVADCDPRTLARWDGEIARRGLDVPQTPPRDPEPSWRDLPAADRKSARKDWRREHGLCTLCGSRLDPERDEDIDRPGELYVTCGGCRSKRRTSIRKTERTRAAGY